MWLHFVAQFGAANIVPIAQRESLWTDTSLPAGVIGKVPSVYNTFGKIVGFKDWQKGRATMKLIEKWAADPRYGFGVILGQPIPSGGVAVCIDVDTENDNYQREVEDILRRVVGVGLLPQRVRDNSSRRAYVLAVDSIEQITKRVLSLPANADGKREAVEILAHGQQFAAWGMHPSGAEIMWLDGSAENLAACKRYPDMTRERITAAQLDEICTLIAAALPVEKDTTKTGRAGRPGKTGTQLVKPDAVALYLDEQGYTMHIGAEGQRHINSPFVDEYTSAQADSDTSVTYFLPGTHGYEQGHFVSLHASDAARTDADFLEAIGFVASQFDAFPAEPEPHEAPAAPKFARDKYGNIEATLPNVLAALNAAHWLGYDVRFDSFTSDIVTGGDGAWRPFRDSDYTWLRVALESRMFKPVGRELIRDAVNAVAELRSIDTAQAWLSGLQWDGVPRVASFFADYFNCERSDYTTAVSLYAWTALAGRVLEPGCKADMMPILIGEQGCGKSTGVEAIAPSGESFAVLSFADNDAEAARKISGVLVAEFGEMNGIKSRAIEAIKQHCTKTQDKWVPKYKERAIIAPRRCVFFGTSNDTELLDDPTGARRWLPMQCGAVDVAAVKRDREQLWAEAAALFTATGVQFTAAAKAAAPSHELFRVRDDLEERICDWLFTANELDGTTPAAKGYTTTREIIDAIGQSGGLRPDRAGQIRAGKALQNLNYRRVRRTVNKRLAYVYEIDALASDRHVQ